MIGFVQDKDGFIYSPAEAEGYFKQRGPFKPVELPDDQGKEAAMRGADA